MKNPAGSYRIGGISKRRKIKKPKRLKTYRKKSERKPLKLARKPVK